MADDEKKPTDNPFTLKGEAFSAAGDFDFLKSASSALAGAAFSMNPSDLYPKMPTMEERFFFTSAEAVIKSVLSRVSAAHAASQNKDALVVTMRTPDGRVMDVESLWAESFATFRADGYVNEMPCSVIGHISTLCLFYAFEERKSRNRVGFRTDTVVDNPPVTESQPQSEQKEP